MPPDVNVDQLGNMTWSCYSARSFTTINRYGQYQAESFRHSLKEETEKLRQVGGGVVGTTAAAIGSGIITDSPLGIKVENDLGVSVAKKKKLLSGRSLSQLNLSSSDDLGNGTVTGNGNVAMSKMIKFGTNVDLSDEKKFHAQLRVGIQKNTLNFLRN